MGDVVPFLTLEGRRKMREGEAYYAACLARQEREAAEHLKAFIERQNRAESE